MQARDARNPKPCVAEPLPRCHGANLRPACVPGLITFQCCAKATKVQRYTVNGLLWFYGAKVMQCGPGDVQHRLRAFAWPRMNSAWHAAPCGRSQSWPSCLSVLSLQHAHPLARPVGEPVRQEHEATLITCTDHENSSIMESLICPQLKYSNRFGVRCKASLGSGPFILPNFCPLQIP